jgi:hypothetical protein
LFGFELPNTDFSESILLIQLQAMSSVWVTDCSYRDSKDYLYSLCDILSKNKPNKLSDYFNIIGNNSYDEAKKCICDSFNSSQHQQSILLMKGFHYYYIAYRIAMLDKKCSVNAYLKYTALTAEEALVCTHTGIMMGITFFLKNPDLFSKEIYREIMSHPNWSEYQSKRTLSSHIFPILTDFMSQIMIARAMTLTDGKMFQKGIDKLKFLEEYFHNHFHQYIGSNFELGWIESSLLNAYQRSGNFKEVKKYVLRIASRLAINTI